MLRMEQAISFSGAHGHKVAAILATPDQQTNRIAVLCHGFLSHKNSTTNTTLTRLLTEQGIATFRFDFFGMGESDGPFEEITVAEAVGQALAALDRVADRGYRCIGLVGSSFGGLVAILAASRWLGAAGSRLACLALKCPVVDFAEELRLEFGDDEMAKWKTTDTVPNITGGFGRIKLRYAFYEDCLRHIAYAPAVSVTAPTLIVQGDNDEHVPLHQSRRLYDALRGEKRLEIVPGADHQFTKAEDFRIMTTLISEWLIRHLSRVEEQSSWAFGSPAQHETSR
jgi:pimeloyl-ACP methyl ester carboxylesterase